MSDDVNNSTSDVEPNTMNTSEVISSEVSRWSDPLAQLSDLEQPGTDNSLAEELKKTIDLATEHDVKWALFVLKDVPSIIRAVVDFPKSAWRAICRLGLVALRITINFLKVK